eukprot:Skav232580  [mRNA]  locus=scaffold932:27205:28575:+ [translate_table: standard]
MLCIRQLARNFSALVSPSVNEHERLLEGLHGKSLTPEWLSSVLQQAAVKGQQPLPSSEVANLQVVLGTEKFWPQSQSAQLQLDLVGLKQPVFLYLKKVMAKEMQAKSGQALRRDLLSNRNEARFYQEFSAEMRSRGVPLLRAPLVEEHFSCLDTNLGDDKEEHLREGGMILLLECADERFMQTSPLSLNEATVSLSLLANFHAAAWEDQNLLRRAYDRLFSTGSYWMLDRRGRSELQSLKPIWKEYLEAFHSQAPDFFSQPSIALLAERLERVAIWVAGQLQPSPEDDFATLMHGDPKAMNMFLPAGASATALIIDFQWTGVGYGVADVAMHLPHSVHDSALRDGGEERLLKLYHSDLLKALQKRQTIGKARLDAFSFDQAWHFYRLAFVDYARMVMCNFFKGASPAAFQSRADKPNVGFVYRNVDASINYLQMLDRHLQYVEQLAAESTDKPFAH